MLIAALLLATYCVVMICLVVQWAWVVVAICFMAALARKGYRHTAYGTARWADIDDIPIAR
jgi:hypothetical protein